MSILRCTTMVVATLALTCAAAAEESWTSADGAITVATPDPDVFQQSPKAPALFLVQWLSGDETLRLGVTKHVIPPKNTLVRAEVEKAAAKEIQGRVTASSKTFKNGHEVWNMTVKGSSSGTVVRITQAVFQHKGAAYKVIATAVGDGPADEQAIEAFIDSIEIGTHDKPK